MDIMEGTGMGLLKSLSKSWVFRDVFAYCLVGQAISKHENADRVGLGQES